VEQLEAGSLEQAFRYLALARKFAGTSKVRKEIEAEINNWLKYAAIRYRVTDDLLKYLIAYLGPEDLREILKQVVWQAAFHGDAALPKLFELSQLPIDLRKSRNFFEALRRGGLAERRPTDGAERGQYLRFVREYGRQLEFASFPILQRQQATLLRLQRDLQRDKDPQWKAVRTETLEQISHLTQGLRTQDVRAQGQRDRQAAPQALGSSIVPPQELNLWPFDGQVPEAMSPQVLNVTLELDPANRERWRILPDLGD
jgi:hypothetical protein